MCPDFLLLLSLFPGTWSWLLGAAQGLSEMFAGWEGCMGCHGEENAHLCRAVELLNAVLSEVGMLGLSPVLQRGRLEERLPGLPRAT